MTKGRYDEWTASFRTAIKTPDAPGYRRQSHEFTDDHVIVLTLLALPGSMYGQIFMIDDGQGQVIEIEKDGDYE